MTYHFNRRGCVNITRRELTDFTPEFVPNNEEALICLNCLEEKCKGECERYKEELKKLKEGKKDGTKGKRSNL